MLAICDSFEALTAGRVTGEALDTRQALGEIRAAAGTKFDPELAELFARGLRSGFVAERG